MVKADLLKDGQVNVRREVCPILVTAPHSGGERGGEKITVQSSRTKYNSYIIS